MSVVASVFAIVVCVNFCGVIWAAFMLENTRWYYCPRCGCYWNEIGERTRALHDDARMSRRCAACARKQR